MKTIVLSLFSVFLAAGISLADKVKEEIESTWASHSYNYGKVGTDCLNIYYNYGIPEFTVNSDDPTILKKLYEVCRVGHRDKLSGGNNLPFVLDSLKNSD